MNCHQEWYPRPLRHHGRSSLGGRLRGGLPRLGLLRVLRRQCRVLLALLLLPRYACRSTTLPLLPRRASTAGLDVLQHGATGHRMAVL